jgi:hypothetical protein
MTNQLIRLVVLLIVCASAGPAYCNWTASWDFEAQSVIGDLQNQGGVVSSVPELSVKPPSYGDTLDYTQGTLGVSADLTMTAGQKTFGISSDALVVDTTPGYGGDNTVSVDATLHLDDTMRCITDVTHHTIRMTSYWYIHGDLGSTVDGHYSASTPPTTFDYVDASAHSFISVQGTGVGSSPYGGSRWADSYHEINSFLTVDPNNYQKDPIFGIPMTLYFTNNVPLPISLDVTAYSLAQVSDHDTTTPNRNGGSAITYLNMGDTFTWGGITSVTDADTGEPISDWTLTSASGTDWATAATPEPSTLVCAASGIALLGLGRARRLATSGGLNTEKFL